MAVVKPSSYSIANFLTLPEVRPPLEFFGGRIIQKMSPRLPHCVIQEELLGVINAYARPTRMGRGYLELRCTFGGSSHVFDLCFFQRDHQPKTTDPQDCDQILIAPDLAVEILSPGQSVGELTRKFRSAIRRGVKLGWLINDRDRSVHVLHPTLPPQILRVGDTLTGDEVLPGFTLTVADLFGWLDED